MQDARLAAGNPGRCESCMEKKLNHEKGGFVFFWERVSGRGLARECTTGLINIIKYND
jgi:hypothetical protein